MMPPPTLSPEPSDAASPKQPITDDDDDDKRASASSFPSPGVSPDVAAPATKAPDCWSADATRTLIDAWGGRYLELNRGNLRQKHWQEVADAVNAVHAANSVQLCRTDVQCKYRIDTIKKKYKIEKSKAVQSNGRYVSTWQHFRNLDFFIGDSFSKPNNKPANGRHSRNGRRKPPNWPEIMPPATNHLQENFLRSGQQLTVPWQVPVGPRSKRSVAKPNFSVIAAVATAMEDDEWCRRRPAAVGRKRKGIRMLAEAIMRLGKVYEEVEGEKQRQIMELEKQKMQFAMDLEIQRMKIFMESQARLQKLKNNSCL